MGNLHAAIKENRKNIETNAAGIKERRKLILENRKTIDENGLKVAELLKIDCFADVASGLDTLTDDEKASIKTALSGAPCEASVANKKQIKQNEAKLHELSLTVFTNKSKLLAVRSIIEENRAMLLKNYACAFGGNLTLGVFPYSAKYQKMINKIVPGPSQEGPLKIVKNVSGLPRGAPYKC